MFLCGLYLLLLLHWRPWCEAATSANDVQVLENLYAGVKNQAALSNWGKDKDPCGNAWAHVKCSGAAVVALEMSALDLGGTVTPDINQLKSLTSIQLQGNGFSGPLPSLSGLTSLSSAYFGGNDFDSIPADFFSGLDSLTELYLDDNRLNSSQGGWSLPPDIQNSTKLLRLSLRNTTLAGEIPDFLGRMASLKYLYAAYNRLHGTIPASFSASNLIEFQVNNQQGAQQLTGPIDPVTGMQSLTTLWLHVNQLGGVIPDAIGSLSALQDLRLNDNQFVGMLPQSLKQLSALKNFTIKGNRLVGPMPQLGFSYDGNPNGFCQPSPGTPCDPRVSSLLSFLDAADGFTSPCTSSWKGNDPCGGDWLGISCSSGEVTAIQLPNCQLSGNISGSLADLKTLASIRLQNNRLQGLIPAAVASMPSLKVLDLFNNSLSSPLPRFSSNTLQLNVSGNPLRPVGAPAGPVGAQGPSAGSSGSSSSSPSSAGGGRKKSSAALVAIPVLGAVVAVAAASALYFVCKKKRAGAQSSSNIIVHPSDSDIVKEAVKQPTAAAAAVAAAAASPLADQGDRRNSGPSEIRVDTGSLVIPIHVLRKATNNFNEQSILGRGGFGVVYLGELEDGTKVAVKRMEATVVSNKGLSEFQAEIEVLTKVRHRHLVALLGYCIDGPEKLLVYEYMPQGTLSQHLFDYSKNNLPPLTWKHRLAIALDVARGIEYLHGLAHKSFIHRDLKPSNILLGDDLRAKVADFGLVKLAPEGKVSVETRLAGTFGYLAPEYAVTGRVTTKVDVYSYGVILMELITGRQALDPNQAEENIHLPTWFRRMRMHKERFRTVVDSALEVTDEELQSIDTVAELAGHCTMREPYQRPDMSHAVNVLAPMLERWKPSLDFDADENNGGIDLGLSLSEALRRWEMSESSANETQDSFPTRPPGFADAADVR